MTSLQETSRLVKVDDHSQVAGARREATELAADLGFDANEQARLAIVASELGTNLLTHAGGGDLRLRPLQWGGRTGLEMLALDRGPGMDTARSMTDGFSTAGTAGEGLGAVRRQSHDFDHYSSSRGSVVMARRWRGGPFPAAGLATAAISTPRPGSPICGDGWLVEEGAEKAMLVVADGLGHGPLAAEASRAALQLARDISRQSPSAILDRAHDSMRHTRGAAVAIAQLDRAAHTLRFAGIGNISGILTLESGTQHLVSHNGTAGRELLTVQEYTHPWPSGALVIMHSDGLTGRWRLSDYPGLADRDPAVIAGVLYCDLDRGDDDATILVARER